MKKKGFSFSFLSANSYRQLILTGWTFRFFSPRGSSKRVSSNTRCKVGSLVPQISLSVMMTCESSVSHSPGPSCTQSNTCQLKRTKLRQRENISFSTKLSRRSLIFVWCCWWDGDGWQTSFDCRMLWRGIHTVPTMVSQINPLFHTSTVRPKSRRLISLRRNREEREKCPWTVVEKNENRLLHNPPWRSDTTYCYCWHSVMF